MGLFNLATRRTRFGLRHLPGLRAAVLLALAPLPLLAAWGAYSLYQLRLYHQTTNTVVTLNHRWWSVQTVACRDWHRVSPMHDWRLLFRPWKGRSFSAEGESDITLSLWMLGPLRIVEQRIITRTPYRSPLQTSQN